MTKVSRYPVRKDVEERMFEIFSEAISHLRSTSDIEEFLEDFLSPVEKIMLAKRLSIALLLEKGHEYETISEILRVTPTTISTVSARLKYSGKGYKKMAETLLRKEQMGQFWEKFEDLLVSIPHSKGSSIVRQKREREAKNVPVKNHFKSYSTNPRRGSRA